MMATKKKAATAETQTEEPPKTEPEEPQPEEQPKPETQDAPETETTTPPENWRDIRSPIEATHNKTRADREQQYVDDRVSLENDYHSDLQDIQTAKQEALVAAGLNPDGGPPSDYGQTAPDLPPLGGI
jgi:hypothetical protein